MERFDLCVLTNDVSKYEKGTFAIILDTDEGEYYNLELWHFEKFEGAELCYLDKKYLRLATKNELKEYQLKFEKFCNKNNSSNTLKKKDLSSDFSLLDSKLVAFIEELKVKGYPSYEYFSEIREELRKKETEGKLRLKSSFAITQYANFTRDLEEKLKEIISLT